MWEQSSLFVKKTDMFFRAQFQILKPETETAWAV